MVCWFVLVLQIGNWQAGIAAVCSDIWQECWDEDEHRGKVAVGWVEGSLNDIQCEIKSMRVD